MKQEKKKERKATLFTVGGALWIVYNGAFWGKMLFELKGNEK